MITEKLILDILSTLDKNKFDIHTIDDAWYSEHALTAAISTAPKSEIDKIPKVSCVRIRMPKGMLELYTKEDKVNIMCYCCFGGNPDKGTFEIKDLLAAVKALEKHYCPPWPG